MPNLSTRWKIPTKLAADGFDPPVDYKDIVQNIENKVAGGAQLVANAAARAAIPAGELYNGKRVSQLDDRSEWEWTGSAWLMRREDTGWTAVTLMTGYTGGENLGVRRIGSVVHLRGTITKTAGAFSVNDGSTDHAFTLPTGFRPLQTWRVNLSVVQVAAGHGTALVNTDGRVIVTATGAAAGTYRVFAQWLVD